MALTAVVSVVVEHMCYRRMEGNGDGARSQDRGIGEIDGKRVGIECLQPGDDISIFHLP